MSIKRYGVEGGTGTGGQHLPFARAVEAGGWLYVSGQTPMKNGEVVEGGIVDQSRLAIECADRRYHDRSGLHPGRRGAC